MADKDKRVPKDAIDRFELKYYPNAAKNVATMRQGIDESLQDIGDMYTRKGKYAPKTTEEISSEKATADKKQAMEDERVAKEYNKGRPKSEGMKKGGSVSSASKRADGCAQRGKTKGRML
jgi:hypothetical protein